MRLSVTVILQAFICYEKTENVRQREKRSDLLSQLIIKLDVTFHLSNLRATPLSTHGHIHLDSY